MLRELEEQRDERAEELTDLVREHVTPSKWAYSEEGGFASISEYDNLLVIGHTRSGHRKVSELLSMLRQAQAVRSQSGTSSQGSRGAVAPSFSPPGVDPEVMPEPGVTEAQKQ